MFKRIKRALGLESAETRNEAGLDAKRLSCLEKNVSRLKSVKAGLPAKAMKYLLDGEGGDVLLELRGYKDCGAVLKLHCGADYNHFRATDKNGWEGLLGKIDPDRPAFYLRLALFFEACLQNSRQLSQISLPGISPWLLPFFLEANAFQMCFWSPNTESKTDLSAATIEKMLELNGDPTDMLVRAAFHIDPGDWATKRLTEYFTKTTGFQASIANHPEPVLEILKHKDFNRRLYALEILAGAGTDYAPFVAKIAELGVGSAKTVRAAAETIIINNKEIFLPTVREMLLEGGTGERSNAVSLLWKMAGEGVRELLEERLEVDKSKKVQEAIRGVLLQPTEEGGEPKNTTEEKELAVEVNLEPLESVDLDAPLADTVLTKLQNLCTLYNECARKQNEQTRKMGYSWKAPMMSSADCRDIHKQMRSMVVRKNKIPSVLSLSFYDDKVLAAIRDFLRQPELELIHVIRFLFVTGLIQLWDKNNYQPSAIHWWRLDLLKHYVKNKGDKIGLREIANVLRTMGVAESVIGWSCFTSCSRQSALAWSEDSLWPYYWEHPGILEQILKIRPQETKINSWYEKDYRFQAFTILSQFPVIPTRFQPKLWDLALGTGKTERKPAQQCLAKVDGRNPRIIEALQSGKQAVRAAAAEWLSELRAEEAIPALKKALKKEKNEVAQGAMMEALETLGVPIEEFLDRKALSNEAEKSLKKGIPNHLAWFPFAGLPEVHWSDSKETVDPNVVKWLVALSCKLNSPDPSPILRKYCGYLQERERRDLGKYVFDAWLSQDTQPIHTREEALSRAKQQAQQYAKWYPDDSQEALTQRFFNQIMSETGSAIKEKGLLAIPAACGTSETVAPAESYLKKWYGIKLHQSKALVRMLSWIDDPLAIQLLLSVSNRFRTKSIQNEAENCVAELAGRQGWTVDQLADRTIPTGGLDDNGKLELDYGSRTFIAKLDKDFKFCIFNEDGKSLKSLPNAGKNDDPDLVKAAKKDLSAAKKILKTVLRLQKDRLYEGMCTQREWLFDDLSHFLFEHPVLSQYCTRLVWVIYRDGKPSQTFRPLGDGSLTDLEDNDVIIEGDTPIRLAHSCNTDSKTANSWIEHFDDYELESLFVQFREEMFTLNDEDKEKTEISAFQGYMLDNYKLRSVATKLGYSRGQAEDGGCFYTYHKRFPGLEMEAILEFSGMILPEENVKVALRNLYFHPTGKENEDQGYFASLEKIALEEIPSVLLSETWNDLKQIANSGSGFEKDWEKKTEY